MKTLFSSKTYPILDFEFVKMLEHYLYWLGSEAYLIQCLNTEVCSYDETNTFEADQDICKLTFLISVFQNVIWRWLTKVVWWRIKLTTTTLINVLCIAKYCYKWRQFYKEKEYLNYQVHSVPKVCLEQIEQNVTEDLCTMQISTEYRPWKYHSLTMKLVYKAVSLVLHLRREEQSNETSNYFQSQDT